MNHDSPQASGNRDREADLHRCSPGSLTALIVVLACCLNGVWIFSAKPLQSANDRSRWCTVWSLVERGTFAIDEIRQEPGWDTIDLIRDNGHFYSTKPPLLSILVAGLYWLLKQIFGCDLLQQTPFTTRLLLLLLNGGSFLAMMLAMRGIVLRTATSVFTQCFVLIAIGFSTPLIPFFASLNNHTPAAVCVAITLWSLVRIVQQGERDRDFLLAGFFAGLTVGFELPAICWLGLVGIGLIRKNATRTMRSFVPAALVPLLIFAGTNWLATGELKPAYASYGSPKYQFVHEGIPSYWSAPGGIDQNLDSPAKYVFHCLVGHHGWFSLTPLFLMTLLAWRRVLRISPSNPSAGDSLEMPRFWKPLSLASALAWGCVLLFYFTRTQNYNYGGVSVALRWAIWLVPMWIVGLIPLLDGWKCSSGKLRCWAMVLLGVSTVSAWSSGPNPWQSPWLFRWMEHRGWFDYSDPLPELPRTLFTWFDRIPEPSEPNADSGQSPFTEWSSLDAAGETQRLRLAVVGVEHLRGKRWLRLRITESNRSSSTARDLLIDPNAFAAGEKPSACVQWPNAKTTDQEKQADLSFLRGIPRLLEYHSGSIRYLKTGLRTDAFRCQRAAAEVLSRPADQPDGPELRFRCDVWLCPEIPFGTLRWETTVSDHRTGQFLHHTRWEVTDSFPPISPHSPLKR